MTHQLETTRIFLDDHQRGVVTCPYCGDTHALNMTRYPAPLGGKACHVLCGACGRLFRLIFDGRRHLRIPVSLPGRLFPSAPQDESDELSQKLGYTTITVTSLSTGGIGFRTQTPVSCTVGDRYYVIFVLPDHDHSLICEDIIIRRSDPQGVGAAFCRPPGSNHALDWYIYVTSTLAPPPVGNTLFPRRLSGSREEVMTAAHAVSSARPTLCPQLPLSDRRAVTPQPRHDLASAAERHRGKAASPASGPALPRRRLQQNQEQDHPIRES